MFGRLVFLVLMGGVISQDFDSSLLTDIFGSQDGAMTEELEVAVIGSDKIKSNGTCRTEEGEDGRCILVKYCDVQETGYAKIELGDSRICNNYLETCCSTLKIRDVPNIPPVNQGGCGLRNPNGVMARLTTENEETQFGEFPWMVAVLKVVPDSSTSGTFNQYLCGGSLIHPSVVATVAHKIPLKYGNPDVASLRVRAGEWDTQTRDEPLQHQTRSIRNLVIHENLQRNNGIYDICLLFLELPMVLEPHIGVVCLPPPSDYPPLAYCTASGWGKDTLGPKGRYQQILKKADLQVVSRERCRMALRRTRLSSKFELHESLACAGGEAGQDTCEGDGGSPLVCNVPMSADRYMLAGIVSWGIGCGQSGIPGVYVNVPYLRSWIDQQLRKNYINMSPYQPPKIQ